MILIHHIHHSSNTFVVHHVTKLFQGGKTFVFRQVLVVITIRLTERTV